MSVDAYFEKQEADVGAIAVALREVLDAAMPSAEVKLAWGFPCWINGPKNRVASIIAHTDRCNLQLWQGSKLAVQFSDRIEGTGKDLRHEKVRSLAEVDAELRKIVDTAVGLPSHIVR